jgi:cytochrome P450
MAMRAQTLAIAHELVDARAASRTMDVVADLALPLPMRVIGTILGIPASDHKLIGDDAKALNPVLEFLPMSPTVLARANEAVQALAAYFTDLAARRRTAPTDDLFSAMVHSAIEGDQLSDDELIANAILLYVAGHETSAGATGLALLALHRNPDQFALLRNRPELIPGAAEELLRYDSPGQGTARVLVADATFGDTTLPAGSMVLAYLGAANRDPDVFAEPDRLDVTRELTGPTRPATWGGGAHLCLGRALALQELEAMLETVIERCPGLTVDDWQFRPTPLMRGLDHLHVHW